MKEPSPPTPLPQCRERGTRIFLVGGRGAGKTTVGRLLASELSWAFVDVDDVVERETGQTVATTFAEAGELEFRRHEAAAFKEVAALPRHVVATGGGVVLSQLNRDLLIQHGFVVWLTATPEIMFRRISADKATVERRPNLTPIGGLAEVELMLRQREPLYQEVADLVVDTSDLSPEGVVSAILAAC
jgi:shikimate kinase